jgi:hypothetical protein
MGRRTNNATIATETPNRRSHQRIVSRSRREEIPVLRNVIFKGGFSIFWVTENQSRARAAERLERRSVIVRKKGKGFGQYPWCGYKLGTANNRIHNTADT